MADPLSIVASVTGVLAFAAATARGLTTIVQDIRDAPEDILAIGRDVQTLTAVLSTAHDTCARHDIGVEDKDLAAALSEYVGMCQEAMQGLNALLKPLVTGGSGGRRSPIRFILGWTMRKGEVRTLRGRLNEGKASLTLTMSALNGVLEGKGQEDIRADISKVYGQMMSEFRNLETGRRVKRRVEDDLVSVSASRERRSSVSGVTDATFAMRRFLDPKGANTPAPDLSKDPEATTFLSPWSHDPNAILEAVRSQNRLLINTLISQGMSLSPRSGQGYTVLHYCAIADDAETAILLLKHGAEVNAKDYELRSPFRLSLASDALSVACVLVEHGCVIGDLSATLLELLARREELPDIKGLLRALARRLNETNMGPYLIHEVVMKNDRGALELLLDAGFIVTKPDQNGLSPFHLALRSLKQPQPVMKLLLEHGADINDDLSPSVLETIGIPSSWHQPTLNGRRISPLVIAARYMRDTSMVLFLLENGADPNRPLDIMKGAVLNGVCAHDYTPQAKALIQGGADPNRGPVDGRGPMYWAAICNNNEVMACMIAHGGNVNHQAVHDGSTPLSIAASQGNKVMVKMLLDAGADPSRRNKGGKTALDLAKSGGKAEVVLILEKVRDQGTRLAQL